MAYQQGQQQPQQQQQQQRPPQQGQAYGGGQNPQFISDQASRQQHLHHQQQQQQHQQQQNNINQQHQRDLALFGSKPPPVPTEYVYFDRNPSFSKATLEKAQAAKLKLEHYYQKAVQEAIERNTRSVLFFFPFLSQDGALTHSHFAAAPISRSVSLPNPPRHLSASPTSASSVNSPNSDGQSRASSG